MCVSEAVGHGVLEAVGLPVADAYAVQVSDGLAGVLTETFDYEKPVQMGRHWGTRLMRDRTLEVELKEESSDIVNRLGDPADLFRMYLADTILAYPDRGTQGNALLRTTDEPHLVPIDQSDCFDHLKGLEDRDSLEDLQDEPVTSDVTGMERLLLEENKAFVEDELDAVRDAKNQIVDAAERPAEEWYERAEIEPDHVKVFLEHRVANLDELARLDHWRGIAKLQEGNRALDI